VKKIPPELVEVVELEYHSELLVDMVMAEKMDLHLMVAMVEMVQQKKELLEVVEVVEVPHMELLEQQEEIEEHLMGQQHKVEMEVKPQDLLEGKEELMDIQLQHQME
jgi:hypothetical protein